MPGTQPREVHKRRPWRTSAFEDGPEPAFVKRFHDRRGPVAPIGRWRDRRRAGREARRLGELRAAGLPVPAVLSIDARPDAVELRLARIGGARTADQALAEAERADASAERARLARTLGDLLARLHAAGFAHGDLHGGNVLLDGEEAPWLVDAAAVRRGTPRSRARDLVRAAGELRERTQPRWRARALIAYLRGLGGAGDARRAEAAALAEVLEAAARLARRAHVARESDRWLRDSGVARTLRAGDLDLVAPLDVEPDAACEHARRALAGAPTGAVVHGRRARAAWLAAARLAEHGVPAVAPLVLVRAPRAIALLSAPEGARAPRADSPADRAALGALAGTLFDRGLALEDAGARIDARGAAFVTETARLVDARDARRALAAFASHGARTPEFQGTFLAAWRGSRAARAVLARELAAAGGADARP